MTKIEVAGIAIIALLYLIIEIFVSSRNGKSAG